MSLVSLPPSYALLQAPCIATKRMERSPPSANSCKKELNWYGIKSDGHQKQRGGRQQNGKTGAEPRLTSNRAMKFYAISFIWIGEPWAIRRDNSSATLVLL